MIGQRDSATGALDRLTTGGTANKGRKATAILQQDDFFAAIEAVLYLAPQVVREDGALLPLERLLFHIDDRHLGQGAVVDAAGQGVEVVLARDGIPMRL